MSDISISIKDALAGLGAIAAGLLGLFRWQTRRAERAARELAEERRQRINEQLREHDEAIAQIQSTMATKDDLRQMRSELREDINSTISRHTETIVRAIRAER